MLPEYVIETTYKWDNIILESQNDAEEPPKRLQGAIVGGRIAIASTQ
jgi:hypothetical protein